MKLYTCYTDRGKWDFEAYNDKRRHLPRRLLVLEDGEDFIKIEGRKGFISYTLCLCKIDKSNLPTFNF